ncbi:MBL fold metallo-hydrolase [Microvirga sp. W0021]|uniref:MBL fold metallo-hydrolase n=1 Tax=Hohaiivirga grylli TaxID=3133970 RepID=A0ABV0BI35_9HYPH
MTSRRLFLKVPLLAFMGGLLMPAMRCAPAFAKAPPVKKQAPGYYRIMVGDYEVTTLLDGTNKFDPFKLYNNATEDLVKRVMDNAFLKPPVELSINAFLVNTGEKLVLIDTGNGIIPDKTNIGHVLDNLKAAGYQPEDIDDILITHAHGDHIGGLLLEGKIAFPNAIVHISRLEYDYWTSKKNRDAAPEAARATFDTRAKTLNIYKDAGKLKTFEDKAEPVSGFTAILCPGHTPGHTAFLLKRQEQGILFWGDITHGSAIQFSAPEITVGFDTDNKQAFASRLRLMSLAAKERYMIAGAHISFPGLGHTKEGGGKYFQWVPVYYTSL